MANTSMVFKNTLYLYIKMGLSIVVNIFTTSILLRALGESDYGIYSVVGGAIAMLGFISGSMSGMVQRYLNVSEGAGEKNQTRLIFANAIILHKGLALFATFFFIIFGIIFFKTIINVPPERFNPSIIVYLCMMMSTVFSITIAPYDGVLNAHENMKVYSTIGIVDVLFRFGIALSVFFVDTDKLILFAILMAVEAWAVRYITKVYCCKMYEETKIAKLFSHFDKKLVIEMISFAGWNLIHVATSMITLYSMNIIINHYYGTRMNAAMGIATQLTGVLMAFSINMQKALSPVMMKSEGHKDREAVLRLTCIGSKYAFLIFAFWGIPTFFFIDYILEIWLHQVPYYTDLFCRILIISILIEQYFVFLNQTIQAEGSVKKYNIWRGVFNMMPIFVSLLTCTMGAGASWVLINRIIFYVIIGGFINVYFCKVNLNLSMRAYIRIILPTIIPTILLALSGYLLTLSTSFPLLLRVFLLFLLSATLYFFMALNKAERFKILNFIR